MASRTRGADRMRVLGLLLLGLVTLGTLAWFLARNVEVKQERVWEGYHGEARTNDFLAAVRLLGRLGRETHAVRGVPLPKTLGPRDALILPARHLRMTPGQVADLRAWVSAGGLLVAEGTFAEDPDSDRVNDPLFEAFGARLVKNGLTAPKQEEGSDYDAWKERVKAFERDHGVVEADLNGTANRVDLGAYDRLAYEGPEEDLGAGGKMLFLREGQGSVFLFTHLDALRNSQIGQEDHADFLAALVSRRPPGAKAWLVYEEEPPSLVAWLRANAWMVMGSLALLTLLFLGGACGAWAPGSRIRPSTAAACWSTWPPPAASSGASGRARPSWPRPRRPWRPGSAPPTRPSPRSRPTARWRRWRSAAGSPRPRSSTPSATAATPTPAISPTPSTRSNA